MKPHGKNGFRPDHIYGMSKLFQNLIGDQYFKMFGLKICNAIIFNTSGPGKLNDVFYDFSKQFLTQNKTKKIIKINCGNILNKRDFLHYSDTVNALDIISKKGKSGQTYNISTGKLVSVKSLLDHILLKSKKATDSDVKKAEQFVPKNLQALLLKQLRALPKSQGIHHMAFDYKWKINHLPSF